MISCHTIPDHQIGKYNKRVSRMKLGQPRVQLKFVAQMEGRGEARTGWVLSGSMAVFSARAPAATPVALPLRRLRSARANLAADTIFMDLVIFWMLRTDLSRMETAHVIMSG